LSGFTPEVFGIPLLDSDSLWPRFSECEVIETHDPENSEAGVCFFIRAKENAKVEYYKPFLEFPKILKEFLLTAEQIESIDDNFDSENLSDDNWNAWGKRKAERLLVFISRYGPLGLFWHLPGTVFFDHKLSGFALAFTGREPAPGLESLDDYLRRFLVDPKILIKRSDTSGLGLYWPNYSDETFLRAYAEPMDLLLDPFSELLHLQRRLSSLHFDRPTRRFFGQDLQPPEPKLAWPIGITIRKSGSKLQYNFGFSSLLMR
jgi:hypothetical protein